MSPGATDGSKPVQFLCYAAGESGGFPADTEAWRANEVSACDIGVNRNGQCLAGSLA